MSKHHLSRSGSLEPADKLSKKVKNTKNTNCFFITDEKRSHTGFLWNSLFFIESEKILVSGGLEGKINLWDASDSFSHMKSIAAYKNHSIFSINYIPESKQIISTSNEEQPVKLIDMKNPKSRVTIDQKSLNHGFFSINSTCHLSKHDTLLAGGFDKILFFYNLSTKSLVEKITIGECIGTICHIEHLDLVVLGLWGGIGLVDIKKRKKLCYAGSSQGRHGYYMFVQYIKKYDIIWTGSDDGTVEIWNITKDRRLRRLKSINLGQGMHGKLRNMNLIEDSIVMFMAPKKYVFLDLISGARKTVSCDLNLSDVLMYRQDMDGLIVADSKRGIYYLGNFKDIIRFENVKKELKEIGKRSIYGNKSPSSDEVWDEDTDL